MPRVLPFLIFFIGALCLSAESFQANEVQVVGSLEYGETSQPVEYSPAPPYRAFVFNGDRIELTVQGDRKAFVALADGTLKQLASGTNKVVFSLPESGPDEEAYYFVFRDAEKQPGRFTLQLKKLK